MRSILHLCLFIFELISVLSNNPGAMVHTEQTGVVQATDIADSVESIYRVEFV